MIVLQNRDTLIKLQAKFVTAFAVVVLTLLTFAASAQPTDPTEGDCNIPGGGGPDEPCPLDTWVYVLVIAAVIYGAYKMQKKQRLLSA